jgi:5-formyltetrahydrofolate cyclo-ligase
MITEDFPMPGGDASKSDWRAWARQVRGRVHSPDRSGELVRLLADWPPFRFARVILTYLPHNTEPDLGGLLELPGHTFATTRTPVGAPGELTIHPLDPARLERHPLGFLQPAAGTTAIDPRLIDLALIPGLVFDQQGGRLGYGAGNYDRLLPALRADIPLIGVTYDELVMRALPTEPLDVTMTHLLTQKGVTRLSSG